ncbi:MAG TPA: DUF3224 domain-containing protein [Myxococcaceae bacterium]|jgi:hypothetical protein|nr:DUF3224 domain-containing protein [Myxococcaceae bacterium]
MQSLRASGSFEVKIAPAADDAGTGLGRMSLDKVLHGELEGTSHGEMLTAMGAGKDSGAYVAVERVTGTLLGRRGSFALVHRGVMTAGKQELLITVVPGSGTGALQGLEGTFTVRIEPGGKHFYLLEGTLPTP